MNYWDFHFVKTLIIQAGKMALTYFNGVKREFKHDNSVVTQADRKIEDLFAAKFDHPEHGSFLLGEETNEQKTITYCDDALKNTAWIVDPIDGTAPFVYGFTQWGISIGFAQNGKLKEGAILLPSSGELFISEGDTLYYQQETRNSEEWTFHNLIPLDPLKMHYIPDGMVSLSQELTKNATLSFTEPAHATGSCVYSLMYLILGKYSAYLATVYLWDIAAALPLISKAGFSIETYSGKVLTLDISDNYYQLEPKSNNPWRAKDHIIISMDSNAVDYFRKHIHIEKQ